MRMALTFYSHAALAYNFLEDEKLICEIKHLISLETQGLEEYSLGFTLATRPRGDPMEVAEDYAGLKASLIEVEGWGWLPVTAEEAQRCLRDFLLDDWKHVVEVTVAGGTGAPAGKRVLIWCVNGVGAWKVASALSPRLKAGAVRVRPLRLLGPGRRSRALRVPD